MAVVGRRTIPNPEPIRPEDLFYQLGNMLGKQIDLSTLIAEALSGEILSQQQQDQQEPSQPQQRCLKTDPAEQQPAKEKSGTLYRIFGTGKKGCPGEQAATSLPGTQPDG